MVSAITPPHDSDTDSRPSKRIKTSGDGSSSTMTSTDSSASIIPPHPLNVKPRGNAYTLSPSDRNLRSSLGHFALLPEELLAHQLEYLDAAQLLNLGGTCKGLYAFARNDELWRALFVETAPKDFEWRGTWRATLLGLKEEADVDCHGLFSDVLYRPFYCAHVDLSHYAKRIPRSNQIARLTNLTADEYEREWSGRPFILTEPVKEWPIFGQWSSEALLAQHAQVPCRAEAVDWPLATYAAYMRASTDESPLYLFDRSFVEKLSLRVGRDDPLASYWVPDCFGEDLFAALGAQRPDSRWMIMGPARSGSTFHKDPNATSAWNAVLTGSKYWLMFPSGAAVPPPPGVIVSPDGGEITAPLSIAEYLETFHTLARATPGCAEGVCAAGEVLHVPSGWFHLVLNLDEGVALTGNFVPRRRLADVLRFLRDTPDHVSGFSEGVTDPYKLFVERLEERHPDVLKTALEELEKKDRGPRAKWEELTKTADANANGEGKGFSFGFGGDSDDDDDF